MFLLGLVAFTLYLRSRSSTTLDLPKPPPPILFKTYTPRTLVQYNGTNGQPVFLAIRGKVFDVTPGRNFYGPGGPYENFAGRDATRGLAMNSFDEEVLTQDLDGPLDSLDGLGSDEWESLSGWEETFTGKYMIVGKLAPAGSPEVKEAEKLGALAS